jgi:hypothetical protein
MRKYTPKILLLLLVVLGVAFIVTIIKERQVVSTDPVFCDSLFSRTHKEIEELVYESNFEYSTRITDVSCVIDIGNKKEFNFTFKNTANKKDPVFVLEISDTVQKKRQALPIDYWWFYDVYTINLHDDINFDGYRDMLVRVLSPRAAQFTYYTFNPETNLFEANEVLSFIFSPTFDPVKKTITTTPDIPNYYTDDNGEQQYYTAEEQTSVFELKDGVWVLK